MKCSLVNSQNQRMENKQNLTVVTYADSELKSSNALVQSCDKLGLKLEVLIHSPWDANSLKIKVLYNFLQTKKPEQVILFVDAFDVLLQENERIILDKFNSLNTDVLFSGEANFSFYDSSLKKDYWKKYPRGKTNFDYINSGACIGKVSGLKSILDKMIKDYEIPINDDAKLQKIKSDQHFFHRFFVDNFYSSEKNLSVKIDRHQIILGCTGGRMTAKKFSEYSKAQSYYFFKIERQLLKFFKLNPFQNKLKDYEVVNGDFIQNRTKIKPSVMHFPGTWKAFDEILVDLLSINTQKKKQSWKAKTAISISYLSQLLSVILSLFVGLPKYRSSK